MYSKMSARQKISLYQIERATENQQARLPESPLTMTLNSTLLLEELETTAILIGIMTGISNSLVSTDAPKVSANALSTFYPIDSAICMSSRRYFEKLGHAPLVLEQLKYYGSCMGAAKEQTMTVLAAVKTSQSNSLEFSDLAISWKRVCSAVLNLLTTLKRTLGDVSADSPTRERSGVYHILEQALRGGRPCIGTDGIPVYPRWAERRKNKRVSVEVPVSVYYADEWFDADLIDISVGGVGLSGFEVGKVGETVKIVLPVGQNLTGSIVWSGGNRCGVEFMQSEKEQGVISRSILMKSRSC